MTTSSHQYSTQVIKGGALIAETFTLIQRWDPRNSPDDNLDHLLSTRALGKPTLKREKDTLEVLRRRYVDPDDGERVRLLKLAHENGMGREPLLNILLYYAMRADPLVHHFCADYLYPIWKDGGYTVNTNDLTQHLIDLSTGDPEGDGWSPPTARRVAQGLLSLARDFGLLHGVNPKKLNPPRLAFPAFVYIAYDLHFQGEPNKLVAESDIWHAYFHDSKRVEDLLVRAQHEDYMQYNRAGSTVRIDWELDDPDAVVKALVA